MNEWKNFIIGLVFGIIITICAFTIFYFTTINTAYRKLEKQNNEYRSTISRIGQLADREEYLIGIERTIATRERDITTREREIYNRTEYIYNTIKYNLRGAKDDITAIEALISGIQKLEQMVNTNSNN